MAANAVSVTSEFHIFADRPVQSSTLDTNEIVCKPIVSIDQSGLEFLIPADNDTYRSEFSVIRSRSVAQDGRSGTVIHLTHRDCEQFLTFRIQSVQYQSKRCYDLQIIITIELISRHD
jgi:hypothetical protein